ncbi:MULTISPECIES: hypothetical protein [unclassified Bradyrhizobium]|uniref:hypothetical protein n=1 Tax=unclassified Bradyrhizobium TaxID=2631580 RepID=UPI0024798A7C|nr:MULTISPECIES: hypothetical protein [unclassified Bradyrhizobium]WGR69720.1 hypothetical protein MTX24_30610 [Bradyrhizobium sp. ISRA426]WGR81776.1 hypothetical protein MTX21_15720 [Bradyrhizobium sp. ISRA430]WGR84962.1 hypothetical protein MTX25_30285 [Bradyrhizobium sp. ISRA432]
MSIWKTAIAGSLAVTVIAGQLEQASAAPMPTNVAAMKAVAGNDTTQVYWRGGWGWGLGGLAAGAIIGGAIAASTAPYGYYGGPYYGGYGYPGPYYGYAPAYYGYAPAYGGYYGYRRYYSYRPYRPYYYGYARPWRAYPRPYYRAYW